MSSKDRQYLFLIALHVGIGVLVFLMPPLAKLYGYSILVLGIFWMLKSKNANNEALFISAYIVGSEIFLRMTGGNVVYEFSKYGVMLFLIMGIYYKGFSKNALPYWLYLLFLVPAIVKAAYFIRPDTDLVKIISFNISGPLCLGVSAFYCYRRPLSLNDLTRVLFYAGLPVIVTTVYLILYTPDIRDTVTGTGSNFEMSGGFGPNQVATILGLGMFIFISRVFFNSPTKLLVLVNLSIALVIGYRGLITFSRGGMLTAVGMLVILMVMTYLRIGVTGRRKFKGMIVLLAGAIVATWVYSSLQTSGLIDKRYANQDAAGRVKESRFTGREKISITEIEYFLRNPVFGIGVGKGYETRKDETGIGVLSHNEVTRMLGEHGLFGILCLLILFCTPMVLYLDNRQHVFLGCFVIFWLLTINHAAMRTAAPAFIYSLSLLKIISVDKPAVHRKQTLTEG